MDGLLIAEKRNIDLQKKKNIHRRKRNTHDIY